MYVEDIYNVHRIFIFYPILVQFFLWIDCAKSFHQFCQQNFSISYSAQDILSWKGCPVSAKIQTFWKEAICLLRFKPFKKWKVLLLHSLPPSFLNTSTYFIVKIFYPSGFLSLILDPLIWCTPHFDTLIPILWILKQRLKFMIIQCILCLATLGNFLPILTIHVYILNN